jgi:hypothetical protein
MIESLARNKPVTLALYLLTGAFSLLLFLKNAWVAEDAFIILRSIDQFLLGHGFRWNPHERVQVFTSPLWYLLIIASTAFCKTLYLNLISLSFLLHASLLGVMAALIKNVWRWMAAVLLLTLSQGFFDFTASGLEYPLIYLLLAIFVLLYLRNRHIEDRYWLALSSGLALITRHDLLFILAPMLLHVAWIYRQQLATRQQLSLMTLFIAPLMCWSLFSLVYYGLPFPNTAYAKLGINGVSRLERIDRGLIFLAVSLKMDPITPLFIAFAILRGIFCKTNVFRVLAASLLLAFLYITWIGADYMIGRFYAPLYLVGVLALTNFPWQRPLLQRTGGLVTSLATGYMLYYMADSNVGQLVSIINALGLPSPTLLQFVITLLLICLCIVLAALFNNSLRYAIAFVFAVLLGISTQQHDSPWQTGYRDWGKTADYDIWWNINNVSRERYFIYRSTSLYAWLHRAPDKPFPDHTWCHEGIAASDVQVLPFAGLIPYCMGTEKIAIDVKALTDPLLPRMPKVPEALWASGGVNRIIPTGYLESVKTGDNRIEDPDLKLYYDKLLILTRAEPLFTSDRLATIIAFNLGFYDHWLDAYTARLLADPTTLPQ